MHYWRPRGGGGGGGGLSAPGPGGGGGGCCRLVARGGGGGVLSACGPGGGGGCCRLLARGVGVVSYPDPDSHSCGWITSPLRGKRVWRTAVLNSVHGHQNVGEPIRFEVCNNSLLTRVY